jgi:hypothetical protein
MGVAKIYTPKDFEINTIMSDVVCLVDEVVRQNWTVC